MIPQTTKQPTKVSKDHVKLGFKRHSIRKHRSGILSNSKHPLSKWLERLGEMIETSNDMDDDSETEDCHKQVLKPSGHHLYSGSLIANTMTCRIPITTNKSTDAAAILLFSRPRKSLKKPRRNAFAIPCIESVQALTDTALLDKESSGEQPLAWSTSELAAVLDATASSSFSSLEPSDYIPGDCSPAIEQLENVLPNVNGMTLFSPPSVAKEL
jgi:hypothetical protein